MSTPSGSKKQRPPGSGGVGGGRPHHTSSPQGKKPNNQQSAKKRKGKKNGQASTTNSPSGPKVPASSSEPVPLMGEKVPVVPVSLSSHSPLVGEDLGCHSTSDNSLAVRLEERPSVGERLSPKLQVRSRSPTQEKERSEDYGVARRLLSFTRGSGEGDSDISESTTSQTMQSHSQSGVC